MNQGICYLYEYENDCRKRNIGFLQITQHYHSCRISLHLKALPVPPRTTLELHAFYLKDATLIHTPAAILNYSGGSIATQLSISESLFPDGKTLNEIDGFLLLPQNSNHPFLWIASRNTLPVSFVIASDTDDSSEENEEKNSLHAASLQDSVSESSSPQEIQNTPDTQEVFAKPFSSETSPSSSDFTESGTGISDESTEDTITNSDAIENAAVTQAETTTPKSVVIDSESSENTDRVADSDNSQNTTEPKIERNTSSESSNTPPNQNANKNSAPISISNPTIKTENSIIITNPVIENRKTSINAPTQQQTNDAPSLSARKITRKELSILPRRFWGLANNSFLLHGYHNYDHLLLIEEDGHVWLGVPGIYDEREARAAELFGFPQFTRSYVSLLNLSDEERNDQGDFGHWCRYLDF